MSATTNKIMTSSTIISNLSIECECYEERVIAYFYFKDGQRHEFRDLLQSIIKQICMKMSNLSRSAISTIKKHRNTGERPNDSQLIGFLRSVIEGAGAVAIYIVVNPARARRRSGADITCHHQYHH